MKSILTLLLFLLSLSLIMASSPFVGEWKLTETLDQDGKVIPLPESQRSSSFVLRIYQNEKDDTSNQFRLNTKIGNTTNTKFELLGGDTPESQEVKFGGVMSTMMMPSRDLYELEKYLSKTLEKVTSLKLTADNVLVFGGEGGTFSCVQN